MRKAKSQSFEGHCEMLERLGRRLAYMTEAGLRALKAQIARMPKGTLKNVWPDEITILHWAWAIEAPPAGESEFVRRIMASRIGLRAAEAGPFVLVCLMRHLKLRGHVPTNRNNAWALIHAEATDSRLRVEKTERIAAEDASRIPPRELVYARMIRAAIERAQDLTRANEHDEKTGEDESAAGVTL
ncbi:MAG: hypothetical protein AAFR17_10540 [Pseudomonadota bacterium]